MSKLFKKMPIEKRKISRCEIRLTALEAATISASAEARNLSVCEYIRRSALGRRTDVFYESQIILALAEVVEAIKMLHEAEVELGLPPTYHEWNPVIEEAVEAMLRISK
jgi:uncharacterized protein (DUF1778 family)